MLQNLDSGLRSCRPKKNERGAGEEMNTLGNKVVLVSKSGYSPVKNQILRELISEPIALFCVVGQDCQKWEDAMDELCVGDGSHPVFIPTTSHLGDTVEEVVEFASVFSVDNDQGMRIVEI